MGRDARNQVLLLYSPHTLGRIPAPLINFQWLLLTLSTCKNFLKFKPFININELILT